MKKIPTYLIYIAILALLAGMIFKIFGINMSEMGISVVYPVQPQSFLNFANTVLLLSIAVSLNKSRNE